MLLTRPGLAKMQGNMAAGSIFRSVGLVVAAALVSAGPAKAQVIQVPDLQQLQPPADGGQAPNDQFAPSDPQVAPDGQDAQPAPGDQQAAPDAQPLAPDTQQPAPDNGQTAPNSDVPQEAVPTHISNPVAVFAGLDKITGRIISFDVYINETVQFGALQVTPRVCYTRPPTEEPQTDAFVEVDEITLARKIQRIFTGWMFAASPGLHAVDNAVYDVWLTDCKTKSDVPAPSASKK